MQQQDVAELLRATASDADAVAQYLLSIDAEEVRVTRFLCMRFLSAHDRSLWCSSECKKETGLVLTD